MQLTHALAIVTVAAGLVTGCGDDGEKVDTATTTTITPSSTTVAPTTTDGTTSTTAVATTAAPPIETGIVLADDGLVVVPFGSSEQIVRDALDPELGEPEDESAECPSGADQILRYDNLTLVLSGGFLVGYVYDSPRGDDLGLSLATADGLVLSAPESELRELYPDVSIEESTLGTEFTVESDRGYLGGLLSEPGGIVTAIFAGDSCAFR
jgi:hypothetical protein